MAGPLLEEVYDNLAVTTVNPPLINRVKVLGMVDQLEEFMNGLPEIYRLDSPPPEGNAVTITALANKRVLLGVFLYKLS